TGLSRSRRPGRRRPGSPCSRAFRSRGIATSTRLAPICSSASAGWTRRAARSNARSSLLPTGPSAASSHAGWRSSPIADIHRGVIAQINAFRRKLQDAVAERVEPSAHGTGLFCDSIPIVYDVNFFRVDSAAPAEELEAEADTLMDRFWHRRVVMDEEGAGVGSGFAALGWTQTAHFVMGPVREPDRQVDTGAVREVQFDTLVEP